jgi:hypothetical protein
LQQYFDGLTAESRPSPSEGLSEEEKQLAKDIEWRKLFEKEVLTEEEARNLIKPYIHRELPGDVLVYNVRDYDVITLLMSHSRPAEKWISVKEKIEALREDCGEDGNYQTYPANQIIDEVLKCFPEGDRV